MIIVLYESLHDDSNGQNMNEVVSNQKVYHEEYSWYVWVVRVLKHVHYLIPVLQSRYLKQS